MTPSINASDPLVLVFGATGSTGQDIVDGILRVGRLCVAALSRSANTPAAEKWKKQGVELRVVDVASDPEERITAALQGVDILLSVVSAEAIQVQRPLFAAAAKVPSIKRVVPSDFAIPCPSGVMTLQDWKTEIREYIRELGLPYTFIDVGWWKQITLPYPPSVSGGFFVQRLYNFYGDGKTPFLVTDRAIIGDFVGRIIEDERTLNHYVVIHEEEVTLEEVWKIAEEVSPDGAEIIAKKIPVSTEEHLQLLADVRAAYAKEQSRPNMWALGSTEYANSIFFRGDNTVARAKELGALFARELYPDVEVKTLREYAKHFYAAPKDDYLIALDA